MTIVALGFYVVHNAGEDVNGEVLGEDKFEHLMYGIILSFLYDIAWFYLNNYVAENRDPEGKVKLFSLHMSYISFAWRFILLAIFWKDQIDFKRIMNQHSSGSRARSASPRHHHYRY